MYATSRNCKQFSNESKSKMPLLSGNHFDMVDLKILNIPAGKFG